MSRQELRAHFIWTQRRYLYMAQHGKCAHCGRWHACGDDMELAHRIADTKANRRKYGANVIDHVFNKGLACRETRAGVDCNDALNCGNRPATAAALVRQIHEALKREEVPV